MEKKYQNPEFKVFAQIAANAVFFAASDVGDHSFQSPAATLNVSNDMKMSF